MPNSTFLEQNVTNWTLSSRRVRFVLNIGVGYGSPVGGSRTSARGGRPHPGAQGPGARCCSWISGITRDVCAVRNGSKSGLAAVAAMILSDLRFMVDAAFAEHGIEIPYPQRDVLAASAWPVRVVPADAGIEFPQARRPAQGRPFVLSSATCNLHVASGFAAHDDCFPCPQPAWRP